MSVYRTIGPLVLIFASKHRLWVLAEAVLTCTHNLCFEAKEKYRNFSAEKFPIFKDQKSLYIAWASFRDFKVKILLLLASFEKL